MRNLLKIIFVAVVLLAIIFLFTNLDRLVHNSVGIWKVPDYYFRNKLIFGFLWGIVGFFFARKAQTIWLKSLVFSGIVAVTLQTRYLIEGYPLTFVLVFLVIHFLILYFLSAGMFWAFKKYLKNWFGGLTTE